MKPKGLQDKVAIITGAAQGMGLATAQEFARRGAISILADYVSLHLPLTDETRHFINSKTINLMKPGAVLINTSRGGLVDEGALVDALRRGRLGGALLDVYEKTPLPVDHAFRTLKNLIFTPHVAFFSEESISDLRRLTAEEVLRHLVRGMRDKNAWRSTA